MTAIAALPGYRPEDRRTTVWLNGATIWHLILAVAALAGAVLVAAGLGDPTIETAVGLRVIGLVALSLTAAASLGAAYYIRRRVHRGRSLSLAVNYLGFVFCLVADLHLLGVFVGLDVLANNFKNGLPFLGVFLIGYLVGTLGDRYDNEPLRQQRFHRIGQTIMVGALLVWTLAVGLLDGLLALAGQFTAPLPFILTIGIVVFLTAIRALWREPSAQAMRARSHHEVALNGWLFLSPNLLGFLIFFAGPLLLSLYVSFTNSDAFGQRDWIGAENYRHLLSFTIQPLSSPDQAASEVLDMRVYDELARFNLFGQEYLIGAEDVLFWLSLRNTLLFVILAVPLSVIPALLLSNILNSKIPGMKFFRAIYFLPSVAAVVGISLIWQWLYNASIGYINYFITLFVNFINGAFNAGWVDPKIQWLSDSNTALLAIVIMAAWQTMGFNTVLFLAGLQNIPRDLYEAATVDGANRWQQFRYVTIPMLAPQTFFIVTTTTISAMQLFDQVFILTNPLGGPTNSTLSMVVYLYQNGFQRFKQGYASANAWVLFILIFALTLFQFQRQRRSSAYEG
jgi:ABC-type sugar transport system permease subunit